MTVHTNFMVCFFSKDLCMHHHGPAIVNKSVLQQQEKKKFKRRRKKLWIVYLNFWCMWFKQIPFYAAFCTNNSVSRVFFLCRCNEINLLSLLKIIVAHYCHWIFYASFMHNIDPIRFTENSDAWFSTKEGVLLILWWSFFYKNCHAWEKSINYTLLGHQIKLTRSNDQ